MKGLSLFNWFRGWRNQEEIDKGEYVYEADICVGHPNVNGYLSIVKIHVDANSVGHARRQLEDKLYIVIQKPRKIGHRKPAQLPDDYAPHTRR